LTSIVVPPPETARVTVSKYPSYPNFRQALEKQCIDARVPVCTAVFKKHSVQGEDGFIISQFYINTFSLA